MDPLPLEQTNPALAEHFRLIANRKHPTVKSVHAYMSGTLITLKDGSVRVKRTGRNDPCPCDSGKKFKACCGKAVFSL